MNLEVSQIALFVLFTWGVVWKAIALWNAARNNQKNWFISLLVINSMGILEIVFLFYYSKHTLKVPILQRWGLA